MFSFLSAIIKYHVCANGKKVIETAQIIRAYGVGRKVVCVIYF